MGSNKNSGLKTDQAHEKDIYVCNGYKKRFNEYFIVTYSLWG